MYIVFIFLTAAPYCNALFERLESQPATRIMWLNVKPLVRGKIPYAPHNARALFRVIDPYLPRVLMVEPLPSMTQSRTRSSPDADASGGILFEDVSSYKT